MYGILELRITQSKANIDMNITEYNSICSEHILTNEYRRVNLDINPFINYRGFEGWFKRTKQIQA